MKKLIAGMTVVTCIAFASYAATPVSRDITYVAGAGSYTYTRDYYAATVSSLNFYGASVADTVTVQRVSAAGRTNAFATLTVVAGRGTVYPTNEVWLFKGDKLQFNGTTTNAAVVEAVIKIND